MMHKPSIVVVAALVGTLWTPTVHAQEHAAPKVRVAPDYLSGEEAAAAELYREVSRGSACTAAACDD